MERCSVGTIVPPRRAANRAPSRGEDRGEARDVAAPGRRLSWRRELAVIVTALTVYFGGRIIVEGSTGRSVANAERLLAIEARLGLDIETRIQSLALDNDLVREIGNLSYVWLHWPLLLTALVVLVVRDERRYRQLRDALFVSGAVGLVLFTVLPMAPPRFMPGFIGTVSDDARRHHLDYPIEWANRYAAFPSFHVGWTLIACLAVAATLAHRHWRAVALVPAALVGISVVTTGNHYLLDAIAGGVIALAAYLVVGRWHRADGTEAGTETAAGGGGDRPADDDFRTDAPGVMIRS